ncbi:MAG: uracil-DNA glycosylase [Bdellovibrionaceae bacterium]|nr:uracil-DNA glycosylase [Pseudobdellovibrionaceae bacterium]
MSDIKLESSWKTRLADEFAKPHMQNLKKFLLAEREKNKVIYPRGSEYFAALDMTPFDKVKVVILGQDPYHGEGQAHGLCFSVPDGVPFPPSLVNIFKELHDDLGVPIPRSGNLSPWAKQGVLLLNSVLTVEAGRAASHAGKGWEEFTDRVIRELAENREGLVFVLWGSYAQKKGAFIDKSRHLVIESPHPSPLSAHRGFFGSRPFSKINAWLRSRGEKEIDWRLQDPG